jgi:hypothetical protein
LNRARIGAPHNPRISGTDYEDAGHSFLNDHHDNQFRMLKVACIGYHQPSERDARRRIVRDAVSGAPLLV